MTVLGRITIYLLVTAIICLLPATVYPEFTQPMSTWERWLSQEASPARHYTLENPSPGIVVAEMIFTAVVLPPSWLFEWRDHKTAYGFMAVALAGGPRGSFHHDPPFLIAALEWWKYGAPFWFAVIAVLSETSRYVLSRRRAK